MNLYWLRYVKGVFDLYLLSFVASSLHDLAWVTLSPADANALINFASYTLLLVVVTSTLVAWHQAVVHGSRRARNHFEGLIMSLVSFVVLVVLQDRIYH